MEPASASPPTSAAVGPAQPPLDPESGGVRGELPSFHLSAPKIFSTGLLDPLWLLSRQPIRALPGRSQNGTHCRHCLSEKETLAHILGACPHGELLRNSSHHKIRSLLASALRGKDYQVEEEVHGLSTNGSTRRIDIIAIPIRSTSGFIIDSTVRMEMYENQLRYIRKNATYTTPLYHIIRKNII
ncbi:hypothetical protein ANN_23107 [Periplaneta americana]|uniref:Reverse transcriptase n=1 Tax=Periplaneta americana TaxID=6978 RepID=A0ABQ8SK65_PERAM|nr:hypothetical protein ANN_23107 [Periplaneta americana]